MLDFSLGVWFAHFRHDFTIFLSLSLSLSLDIYYRIILPFSSSYLLLLWNFGTVVSFVSCFVLVYLACLVMLYLFWYMLMHP